MRCDGWMMPPDPRASTASADPPAPPDMGFDDAHVGGGLAATRVGIGGVHEKPHKKHGICSVLQLSAALRPQARAADAHDAPLVLGFRYPPQDLEQNMVSAWRVPI